MTAIRFDPWAELAAIENAECEGGSAKVAKVAKVAPPNVPAEWADGVARLITLPPPTMVHRPRWQLAVKDARRFLRDWAGQASALGWTTLDVFGAHPTHPVERVDSAGLILLLHGDEVVAITRDSACTRTPTGATLIFYRRPRPDAVLLWELGVMPPPAAEAARHSKATEALGDIARGEAHLPRRDGHRNQQQAADRLGARGRHPVLSHEEPTREKEGKRTAGRRSPEPA